MAEDIVVAALAKLPEWQKEAQDGYWSNQEVAVCTGTGDPRTGLPCICNGIGEAQAAQAELLRILDAERTMRRELMEALTPFGDALRGNYNRQPNDLTITAGSNQFDRRFSWPLSAFRDAVNVLARARAMDQEKP